MLIVRAHGGYNPPKFVTDAAKEALDKVECNQYSPTKVSNLEGRISRILLIQLRGDRGSRKHWRTHTRRSSEESWIQIQK